MSGFKSRREFLAEVGRVTLLASVGSALAADLGISVARAEDGASRLSFGEIDRLVALMQDTPIDKLQPLLIGKLRSGAQRLDQLVAAAALANARKFGGEDYVGYHTLMALAPAYGIAQELPGDRRALPVLKVLYRNTGHIQANGGGEKEVLHPIEPGELSSGEALREAMRRQDLEVAERKFAAAAGESAERAFSDLQYLIQDDADVHRVVLAHRAWSLLDLVGKEHAHTLLRESVRYCVRSEEQRIARKRPEPSIRALLPALFDKYRLLEKSAATREADDAWIDALSKTIYRSSRETAADVVAGALGDGFSLDDVGQALSLTATATVLQDRSARVHGASTGVHASDSVNAWRNIARVSDRRHAVASLVVGAYHVAMGTEPGEGYPFAEHREAVRAEDPAKLLDETRDAIRANDQGRATAAIRRYGELGHEARAAFELLSRFAISEDGRLHGEKYYTTVKEEFRSARPSLRWRHLVGLARATASAYGYSLDDKAGHRAPGYEEACRLLGVDA